MYNRLLARSQALGGLERAVEQWKGTVAQSLAASAHDRFPPTPHSPRSSTTEADAASSWVSMV